MKEFNSISASDLLKMPSRSESETKARLVKERAAYKKMLRDLCPSKEMQKKAKRISKQHDSCDMCVYGKGETWSCRYPYSDWYMEDLNIDPCYEGVLRYLVKEAKENEKARRVEALRKAVEELMLESPKSIIQTVVEDCITTRILCGWILAMAEIDWQIPENSLEEVRELYNELDELLSVPDNDSYGGGVQ